MRMPSGAGHHDAVYVAKTGPVGMIFIPCLHGRSHSAEEWIEPEQLLKGSDVLLQIIVELDRVLAA
ncbi:M20/M25/M40 family metallo-hydrolase [Alcaligenaceae bacterium CGII-47]|nr:M20/M25/M40 family metallo-hydrolase [Alcaligenaceae bacterium CGII-47]